MPFQSRINQQKNQQKAAASRSFFALLQVYAQGPVKRAKCLPAFLKRRIVFLKETDKEGLNESL
jgi:hypothetical protein